MKSCAKIMDIFSVLPESRRVLWAVVALVILLCAVANLPWHLDNYDQAKQAYVSYEIATGGDPWFQHTPRGGVATKPPLAGWISLGLYRAIGNWDVAWRLPGFLSALVLLALLMREGHRLLPGAGPVLAAGAFGLNLLTPRLATLVRTDMMLTLWITLCGLLILRVVRRGDGWMRGERIAFMGVMAAALFTKGPILYAFLLPGMLAFAFLAPRGRRHLVWSGWWTWVLPLALFLAWGIVGLMTRQSFYDEVVVREFLSRFNQDLRGSERRQPIWFYFPHLLHKFLPWSLLLIGLPVFYPKAREAIRENPALLWLACWGLGGLILMTFIPSKRVDRIFPIIPPLSLLLIGMVAACWSNRKILDVLAALAALVAPLLRKPWEPAERYNYNNPPKIRGILGVALLAAALFSGGYFFGVVALGFHDGNDRLARFGRGAARMAQQSGKHSLGLVSSSDEGLLLYFGAPKPLHTAEAMNLWNDHEIDALLIPDRKFRELPESQTTQFPRPALISEETQNKNRHLLFLRP